MTELTDIPAIAASLSKARYTALWNLTGEWGLAPHDGWRRAGLACSGLVDMGLAEKSPIGTRYTDAPAYRLNEIGIAVQSYIKEQA